MKKRYCWITLFAGVLILLLLAGCRPAGIAPGTDTGTDSGIPGTADEVRIDLKNVLTESEAAEIVRWLENEPQTYEALTEKYGKPRYFSKKVLRYSVENDGILHLNLIDGSTTLYKVNRLEWKREPKTDLSLEQFKTFVAGVTKEEEVQKAVGVPHDYIGSGIVRDLYYTADGYKISVYYTDGVVYEILQYNDDGTTTKLATASENSGNGTTQIHSDINSTVTMKEALSLYLELQTGPMQYQDIVLKYGKATALTGNYGLHYRMEEGGSIRLTPTEEDRMIYRFEQVDEPAKIETLTAEEFSRFEEGKTAETEVLLTAGKPHETLQETKLYYTVDGNRISIRYNNGILETMETETIG